MLILVVILETLVPLMDSVIFASQFRERAGIISVDVLIQHLGTQLVHDSVVSSIYEKSG